MYIFLLNHMKLKKICFEFPMQENIRHLLRIEYLFNKLESSKMIKSEVLNDYSLYILFDIMDYASRAEIKVKLLHDLEKLNQFLKSFNSNKQSDIINSVVENIKNLQVIRNKFAQNIRENEWLMTIKHKMRSSGGISPVDYPSYFLWQNFSFEEKLNYINTWCGPLNPTKNAVNSLLSVLGSNFHCEQHIAYKGVFNQSNVDRNISLLQVVLDQSLSLSPELSANYHLMNIRFIKPDFFHNRGVNIEDDINFELKVCRFQYA